MHFNGTNFKAIYLILSAFPLVVTYGFLQALAYSAAVRYEADAGSYDTRHVVKVGAWMLVLWAVYISVYLKYIVR